MREICWNLALPLPSKNFFLVFQDFFKMSWRRLQRNKFSSYVCNTSSNNVFKTSWRCLQVVFARRLQDVFKTSSRCVCKTSSWRRLQEVFKKTSCNYVLKSSWRRLQNVLEDKNMLPWRHLQDIFEASSVRLRQGECFLGYDKVKLFKSIESIPKRTNFARISTFRFNWFWYYLEKRSISSFANNNGSVNHHVSNI